MYMTFDRTRKELISYSSDSPYEIINDNKYGIVHYDNYTVTVLRESIDFIEIEFDETLELEVIVPGQYTLSDEINEFADVLKYKNDILKAGNKLIGEVSKRDINGPLSYVLYMGQLALKSESEYTAGEKAIDFLKPKGEYVTEFDETMKLFNLIEKAGNDFRKSVDMSNTKEAIGIAFLSLKTKLTEL